MDEAERLLVISKGGRNASKGGHDDEELENDQEVELDETDPYNEVTFGRGRPDYYFLFLQEQIKDDIIIIICCN